MKIIKLHPLLLIWNFPDSISRAHTAWSEIEIFMTKITIFRTVRVLQHKTEVTFMSLIYLFIFIVFFPIIFILSRVFFFIYAFFSCLLPCDCYFDLLFGSFYSCQRYFFLSFWLTYSILLLLFITVTCRLPMLFCLPRTCYMTLYKLTGFGFALRFVERLYCN